MFDRIATLLLRAIGSALRTCSAAMILVGLGHLILPVGSFKTNSWPGAVFYFTMLITMFAVLYCVPAIIVIVFYRRYRGEQIWPVLRPVIGSLAMAVVLFAGLAGLHAVSRG